VTVFMPAAVRPAAQSMPRRSTRQPVGHDCGAHTADDDAAAVSMSAPALAAASAAPVALLRLAAFTLASVTLPA